MYAVKDGIIPTKEQLTALYASVGWLAYTREPERLYRAVEQSRTVYTVWQDEELVGLLRVVGDGEVIAYVQDLLVQPHHQRQGLGKRLLETFREEHRHIRQRVLLTDDQIRNRQFYEQTGWRSLEERGLLGFVDF